MSLATKEEEEFNSISRRFQIIEDEFKEQELINAQLEKDQENHDIIIANGSGHLFRPYICRE
jgi:hypothetical protein